MDGGVLNNLPIDVMREMNQLGTVIAIDVVAPRGPSAAGDWGLGISGWRLALERINPRKKATPVPGIATTILQSMVAGAGLARGQMLQDEMADFYLNIHVRGVSMLDFEKGCQIAFLSAIIQLQRRAEKQGGNAVVDIKSITKHNDLESATQYRCAAGTFVANVALTGRVVKLAK